MQADVEDLEGKAADALNGLGFGHWEATDLLKKHAPTAILAAEERLRLTEQDKDIAVPRKYFLSILEGAKKGGSKDTGKQFKDPPWLVPLDLRKRQWLEQCCGCVKAAEMMPSYILAVEKLATEDATRLPGAPHDETNGRLVDAWVEAIDKAISEFKGEAYPRPALAERAKKFKPGTERFVVPAPHKGATLPDAAFEAKRQELRRQAAALVPMPVTLKAPSTPNVQEPFDPKVDDGVPF